MNYTSNISGQSKKTKTKGRCFIPPYYECDLNILGKDNVKNVNGMFYVTPLIRTLLNDISNYSQRGQESLGRSIKDRMDSNSRLLIKKSMERSPITIINNKQYVLLDCRIFKINDNVYRIMNDRK